MEQTRWNWNSRAVWTSILSPQNIDDFQTLDTLVQVFNSWSANKKWIMIWLDANTLIQVLLQVFNSWSANVSSPTKLNTPYLPKTTIWSKYSIPGVLTYLGTPHTTNNAYYVMEWHLKLLQILFDQTPRGGEPHLNEENHHYHQK
jgi:hypothetical protein